MALTAVICGATDWAKVVASGKKRWEEAIKKARENRDEERLQNLLKKGPPTYKSSRWEGEIEKELGELKVVSVL